MKEKQKGYVIINLNHPRTHSQYIVSSTFRGMKKDAIAAFCKDSGSPWSYWKRKYNFSCVKAEQLITTL